MRGNHLGKKKETPLPQQPRVSREQVKSQLSAAAGTEAFQHRDPIYHLTESFRQTFDAIGQQRAKGLQPDVNGLFRLFMEDETPGLWGEQSKKGNPDTVGVTGDLLHKTNMTGDYEPRDWDPQNRLMDKFSEVTFQRGRMSAAILRGQGKMMLFSCLERTVGQEESKQRKERKLFQSSSSHKYIPGGEEDMMVANKGFADSAVGLVVDSLKDARQLLESLTAIAEGEGGLGGNGVGTMEKQYPFLTDQKERDLLAQYQERLKQLKGPGHQEEREVLKNAQARAEAIIQKKDQMRRDFLQTLRRLENDAVEAEQMFSQESFLQEAAQVLSRFEPDLSPDRDEGDGPDGGEAKGGPNEGAGEKRRRSPGTKPTGTEGPGDPGGESLRFAGPDPAPADGLDLEAAGEILGTAAALAGGIIGNRRKQPAGRSAPKGRRGGDSPQSGGGPSGGKPGSGTQ